MNQSINLDHHTTIEFPKMTLSVGPVLGLGSGMFLTLGETHLGPQAALGTDRPDLATH